MKNIILGMMGVFITIYVVCIGLNIYSVQTQQNQLNHTVSRVVEDTLQSLYGTADVTAARNQLIETIKASLLNSDKVDVKIKKMDLKKGLISVFVTQELSLVTGEKRSISAEKTAIMERAVMEEEKVRITFMVDGEIYKEYQVAKGETCPMPKTPGNYFSGWLEYGKENKTLVKTIGRVWEDKVYIAVMR